MAKRRTRPAALALSTVHFCKRVQHLRPFVCTRRAIIMIYASRVSELPSARVDAEARTHYGD